MRFKDARTIPRWTAAAALAIAFCVAVVGAEWALIGSIDPSPHAPHAVVAGPLGDFAVAEHSHAENDTTPVQPEIVAHAVLPRVTTALAALGLVAAMAILATLWRHAAVPVIRGPPRAVANVVVGQALLTQLCIARR